MRDLRTLALATAAFLLIAFGIVAQVFAGTVTLRPEARVEGESLRLKHIFEGIANGGETVISTAPRPGQSFELDAPTLARIASRNGLDWKPNDGGESIRVVRASREIDGAAVEAVIADAVAERMASSDIELELNGEWPSVVAPAEAVDGPVLLDLKVEPRSGRFVALVAGVRGATAEEQVKIAGQMVRTENIPVPARSIAVGEVIGEADLQWRRFRADRLGQDPVLNADAILGKAPRRALRPGIPVRAADLVVPLVIQKGAPVTMIYSAPGIHLTMVGRALEAGANGQWIRVLNPQSKMVAYGAVSPDGTVLVTPGAPAGQLALDTKDGERW